jgi:hypothetical protein
MLLLMHCSAAIRAQRLHLGHIAGNHEGRRESGICLCLLLFAFPRILAVMKTHQQNPSIKPIVARTTVDTLCSPPRHTQQTQYSPLVRRVVSKAKAPEEAHDNNRNT